MILPASAAMRRANSVSSRYASIAAPVGSVYTWNNSIVRRGARSRRFFPWGPKPILRSGGDPMATLDTHPDPSLMQIVRDIRNDASTLFRQEIALAKREVVGKALLFGKNTVFIAAGAVVGLYAIFFVFL